ncbi:HNH endonuclease [Micromonospora haikouensis]|uniref:HNH endonuclease n=1 Tax=Micromonospora haikouensis TaxID=686309 RepID=UPI003D7564EA
MNLASLDRPAVLAAVDEFDRLGRDGFLRTYGFGPAKSYFLQLNGKLYDSKAIAGYAHGLTAGRRLRSGDFTGGDKSVAHRLRALGFAVVTTRNPDWTRDEIVLACALVAENAWRQLGDNDPRVIELSLLLQAPAVHAIDNRRPDFRNPAGVARKTADIATRHPNYGGKQTNGNRLDGEVLRDFIEKPRTMFELARKIRAYFVAPDAGRPSIPDPDLEDASVDEGDVLRREHLRRERDVGIRKAKIASVLSKGLLLACEVCGFDFEQNYGTHGAGYIECHHRLPLHVSGPTRTRLADLALLCSNCHRMIHRFKEWLTVEDLKAIVTATRSGRTASAVEGVGP